MLLHLILTLLGLILLYFGAEWLVGGSSRLAVHLGVAPLIVGLTVVAFGTSSPELLVCLHANLSAIDPMAGGGFVMGNIIGSNIYNIALILAVGALIRPIAVSPQILVREGPFLIGATVLLLWLVRDYRIDRGEGAILAILLLTFLVLSGITSARQMRGKNGKDVSKVLEDLGQEDSDWAEEAQSSSLPKLIGLIVVGLGALAGGTAVLVDSASELALMLGVPPAFVSLTLVAFGTSVPELATVIVASVRKQGDIITGNVIGSNIFNILAILGITALVKPVLYDPVEVRPLELYYMTGLTLLLLPLLITRRRLARWEGIVLLASCLVYTGFLIERLPAKAGPDPDPAAVSAMIPGDLNGLESLSN